jgi:uncharacterized Tic20 family protein
MVQADRQNYEALEGHDRRAISAQEERTWSVLSHLSMFLNLITGFLGPVVALVIWLVYKDRSRKVAFDALESMWYQIGWLVVLAVGWAVTGLLTTILIGFLLIPVMAVVSVVPFVHAAYAAYRASKGEEYRYPVAADLTDGR